MNGFRTPNREHELIKRLDTMNGHLDEICKYLKELVGLKGKRIGYL